MARGALTLLPASAVGGIVAGVVGSGAAEEPSAPVRNTVDASDYPIRAINTEPPTKKVRFNEELDFSKPSEEGRRPSRFATRTREPGNYDFSTPSRGATRQTEPGYDFSTPSRGATRQFEPGHYG